MIFTGKRALFVFISGCFFLSGAAGLVYEVIWVRLIDKVIGGAPLAVATALSVFMAGLAAGSLAAGRTVDRLRDKWSLLALYGLLEAGIGLCAVAAPLGIRALLPVYAAVYDRMLAHFWGFQLAGFAGCVLVLLVPAALMGATLPVLCRFYVSGMDHVGTRTGWLYGLNTVGAALGVALCGFVLIRRLGVWMSLGLFSGINLLVGMSCILLARKMAADGTPLFRLEKISSQKQQPARFAPIMRRGALLFAVSGFCAMAYEVLWTRLLGLMAGPTTYCFTLVVAAFIIGLALGSMIFGRLADRTSIPALWLAFTQMGAALSALLVSQVLGNSQFFFAKLIHTHGEQFSRLMMVQSLVLFGILILPTLFLGAAFPLVNRLCVTSLKDLGRSVGTVYALNTIGALLGSFAAGFVLIPFLGMQNGLRLVMACQFGFAGWFLLAGFSKGAKRKKQGLVLAGAVAAGLVLFMNYPSWRTDLLSRGWYRDFDLIETDLGRMGWLEALYKGPKRIADQRRGLTVVFTGEGVAGFTSVEKEITSLGTVEYALFNSGKADASSHGDRSTQALSAHIPLLFHPHAQKVMVLGLASGMTAAEALLYPIRRLDVVEINREVAKACTRFFGPWNRDCLADPRTRLIVQDGRNHLALTRTTYDVIISEPSNPWMAGLANLYSLEFFRAAKKRLADDGIFVQWIQSYEMDWETFSLLGRTYAAVFPNSALIKAGPVDYLLLGFADKTAGFDWSAARKNLAYAQKSANVTFHGADFLVHLILTEDPVAFFGTGPLHTDNRPHLEFSAPLKLYSQGVDIDAIAAENRVLKPETRRFLAAHSDGETFLDLMEFAASANLPMFNMLPPSRLSHEQQARQKQAVSDYCTRVLPPSYGIFQDPALKAGCARIQARAIRKKMADTEATPMDHFNLGLALMAAGQMDEAVDALAKAADLDPCKEVFATTLGLTLARMGKMETATRHLARAVTLAPEKAAPYKYLGMVELRAKKIASAVANLSRAHALAPEDGAVLGELGSALVLGGRQKDAISFLTKALEKNPEDDQSRYYLKLARRHLNETRVISR